ncbi:MAG: O-antigen ligase family protein [Clostridiales Family XIII bacterium]|jgi:O-antigen ligase|nr:O-antigen ligase family protein [Clostridiales Family XIII bacterium]
MLTGRRSNIAIGPAPILLMLGLFTLYRFVGLFYSYAPAHTFDESLKHGVGFVVFLIAFFLCRWNSANVERLLWLLLFALVIVVFLSLGGDWNGMRMMTVINANVSAALFLIGMHIAAYLYFASWIAGQARNDKGHLARNDKRQARNDKGQSIVRTDKVGWILAVLGVLIAMGFVLCVSVGATLAGGVSILLVCFMQNRGRRLKTFLFYVIILLIGFVLGAIVFTFLGGGGPATDGFFVERFSDITSNPYAEERIQYFGYAIDIFREQNIFFGSGAGAFETLLMQIQTVYSESKYVHNQYLQVLLEGGIVGLALYLAFLILVIKKLFAIRKQGIAPMLFGIVAMILMHSAIDFDLSFIQYIIVAWLIMGIIDAIPVDAQEDENKPKSKAISRLQAILCVSIPLITCALFLLSVIAGNMMRGALAADPVDISKLRTAANTAVAIDRPHKEQYMADYLVAVSEMDFAYADAEAEATADEYAEKLDLVADRSVGLCQALIQYYYPRGETEKVLHYAKMIRAIRVMDPEAYDIAINICEYVYDNGDEAEQMAAMEAIEEIENA